MSLSREKYPEGFERLWNTFDLKYGPKGSKKNAYKEFKKIKPDKDEVRFLITCVLNQIDEKYQKMRQDQWFENFKHVERWLKDERWNDEISLTTIESTESKSERIQRELREYLQGSDSEGVGSIEDHRTH